MRGEDLRRKNWGGSEARDGCKMCQSEWDDHKVFGKDHYNEIEEVLMHMEVLFVPSLSVFGNRKLYNTGMDCFEPNFVGGVFRFGPLVNQD